MAPSKGSKLNEIAICIPLRDEAAELPGLFGSLEALDGPAVRVCLLLDGCTDRSAALAEEYRARSVHHVSVAETAASAANAGKARRRAMALGLATIGDGILLTTDADSRPARDWLDRMRAALGHAGIVAGRIVRSGDGGASALQDRIEHYYDALYALRRRIDRVPWEAARTHHFTGGANLGFRTQAYRAVGGFLPLASGEDARIVDDAGRAGIGVRRDAACVVHTSDRRVGRAEGGLAHALRSCDVGDALSTRVAHPADATWQYRLHALARGAHAGEDWASVAAATGLGRDHVRGVARDCPNGEAFAMRVVPAPPGGMRSLTLPQAEAALAALAALGYGREAA